MSLDWQWQVSQKRLRLHCKHDTSRGATWFCASVPAQNIVIPCAKTQRITWKLDVETAEIRMAKESWEKGGGRDTAARSIASK